MSISLRKLCAKKLSKEFITLPSGFQAIVSNDTIKEIKDELAYKIDEDIMNHIVERLPSILETIMINEIKGSRHPCNYYDEFFHVDTRVIKLAIDISRKINRIIHRYN
jgi:hypothetical protein